MLWIVAQAIPPLWTIGVAAWLLAAIPSAFAVSVMAVVLTVTPYRTRRVVRWLALLGLVVGLFDVALVAWFASFAELGRPGLEEWVWIAMMAATVALSATAWMRARAGGREGRRQLVA
ncbi:MAG TPA: hypothetical protein VFS60_11010 [Thermoanaerobaculia bacterium]|nr:hypothetical protein [Thermoanaerobaculia bacterium]